MHHQDKSARNRQFNSAVSGSKQITNLTDSLSGSVTELDNTSYLDLMSHEIRTPLSGVISMANLLLDTDLNDEQRLFAEIIQRSGNELLGLVNDMLDLSRLRVGKLVLDQQYFNLRTALNEMNDLLAIKAQEKGLEYICQVQSSVPQFLMGDPGRLRQILVNLVGNAIKFTERGEVIIRIELLCESETDSLLKFSVSDTGIGIDSGKTDSLFEPFTQADETIAQRFGGTGLGLAIANLFVEKMGGMLQVESRPGSGTTFHFAIAFDRPAEIYQPTIPPAPDVSLVHQRFLIVNDFPANRCLICEFLTDWGCSVSTVSTGQEAIAQLEEANRVGDPYTAVVLDSQLSDMTGEELGCRIKALAEVATPRLVMMAAIGVRGDVARLQEIGFNGYLTKPIKQAQLHDGLVLALFDKVSGASGLDRCVTRYTIEELRKIDSDSQERRAG